MAVVSPLEWQIAPPALPLSLAPAAAQPHSFTVMVVIAGVGNILKMVYEEVSCHLSPS